MTIKLMASQSPTPALLAWTAPVEDFDVWADRGFVFSVEELLDPTDGCTLRISAGAPTLGVKAGLEVLAPGAAPTFLGMEIIEQHGPAGKMWLSSAVQYGVIYLVTTEAALGGSLLQIGEHEALLAVAAVETDDQVQALVRDFTAE
jgi:hypothetical protein